MNRRDAGLVPVAASAGSASFDPYVEKVEELVERSRGDIRADVVHHQHLLPMGFAGDERTTRRAVAEAKAAWFVGAAARWQARPRRSPIERRRSDNAVEARNPSGPRGY